MGNYITSSEIIGFIGTSCDEGTASLLADMSEAFFNQLINSPAGLLSSVKTEYFDPKRDFSCPAKVGKVFLLRSFKPTAITTVNGVSAGTLNTNFTLTGRRLEFEFAKDYPAAFPYRYTVVYTSGLTADELNSAKDIKTACLYIAKGLFERKKHMDVSSFKQDLLTVNFTTGKDFLDVLSDASDVSFIKLIVNKYLVPYFYAI